MTLHLIKLCVGADSLEHLSQWQEMRLAELKKKKKPLELMHVTRQTPKRAEELLDGGSLYWVIKGQIAARQHLIALRPLVRNGVPHCGIVYDPELIATARRTHRPFQGWRYLNAARRPDRRAQPQGRQRFAGSAEGRIGGIGAIVAALTLLAAQPLSMLRAPTPKDNGAVRSRKPTGSEKRRGDDCARVAVGTKERQAPLRIVDVEL